MLQISHRTTSSCTCTGRTTQYSAKKHDTKFYWHWHVCPVQQEAVPVQLARSPTQHV